MIGLHEGGPNEYSEKYREEDGFGQFGSQPTVADPEGSPLADSFLTVPTEH